MDKQILSEMFTDAGFNPSDGDMEHIYEEILNDLTNRADIDSYTHDYSHGCDECKNKDAQIESLERQLKVHEDSVRIRRNCDKVWTENGRVYYE